ncbi:MAG: 3-deoxy-7-phosphoheptulonate synthase [Clostridia bacterium]|nr:3-deoxy-7-phosphoheptulonate synthase [Clostridia bacterium]
MNLEFKRKLPVPKQVKAHYLVTEDLAKIKTERDNALKDIFSGKSDKFLLIIGPCSADSKEPVLDYVSRLRAIQDEVKDKIFIVPRIYTNKPRTTGDGYKGMLHQPDPDETPDMLKGILSIRDLHMSALNDYGFTCADEMLYPDNYRYLSDLLAYVAVGARSVENQQHRLVASGIEIPVGMKNPTSGDMSVMLNSITAAQHPQTFISRGWEVTTDGNPLTHAILRGSVDSEGRSHPNYHYEDLVNLYEEYSERNLKNMALIVDTNHPNSGKKYLEQVRICKEVLHSCRHSADIKKLVKGFMIESYIEDGSQKIGEGVYGKSITDPCLGWEKTERLVLDMADLL